MNKAYLIFAVPVLRRFSSIGTVIAFVLECDLGRKSWPALCSCTMSGLGHQAALLFFEELPLIQQQGFHLLWQLFSPFFIGVHYSSTTLTDNLG